jgi:hypothetical protein
MKSVLSILPYKVGNLRKWAASFCLGERREFLMEREEMVIRMIKKLSACYFIISQHTKSQFSLNQHLYGLVE